MSEEFDVGTILSEINADNADSSEVKDASATTELMESLPPIEHVEEENADEADKDKKEKKNSEKISFTEKMKNFYSKYGKVIVTVFSYLLCIAIFLSAAGAVVYFITVAYRGEFHSDCTDTIIWANASYESGNVYDPSFHYACFLPFGMNVIMQPLISLFGLTMKAQICGMLAYFGLLTLFFGLMLREMHWGFRSILLGCSVMLSITLSSQKMREIFWQHTIYYTLGILFIVIGLFMYFKLLNLQNKQTVLDKKGFACQFNFMRILIVYCCLSVFVMLTATDGISALSIFALPFVAAIAIEHIVNPDNKLMSKKTLLTMSTVVLFLVMIKLGIALNDRWVGGLEAEYQEANSTYSSMDDWMDHLHQFPMAWLRLNGVRDMLGMQLTDADGLKNLLQLVGALLLLIVPIIATCCYGRFKDDKDDKMLRLCIWLHWMTTSIVLLGYIIGVLSEGDWRITPIVGTSIIVTLTFIRWAIVKKVKASRFIALLAVPLIASSAVKVIAVYDKRHEDYTKNNVFVVADYLEDEGLTYGYANFWNASSITLITDSKVKVRNVLIQDTCVQKHLYQSSDKWFEDQNGQSEYFLLVDKSEYDTMYYGGCELIDDADETKEFFVNDTKYYVLIFDHNIF